MNNNSNMTLFNMKNLLSSVSLIFIVMVLFVCPVHASNIVSITVDSSTNIPFLLDDKGQVWAFRRPLTLEEPIKLPNLNHIKKIEPFIAVDVNGQVFTWNLNKAGTQWDESGIAKATYTNPEKVGSLQGVTDVAYAGDRYVAVIGNKEIVEWEILRETKTIFVAGYAPIRNVISRQGVKAIAAISNPEIISIKGSVLETSSLSLVALFDDGTVMGWGIKPTGAATRDTDRKSVLLTQSPGATDVAINPSHTVILAVDGVPRFWGGCDGYGKDPNGRPWSPGNVMGAAGLVSDVIGMAVFSGNDNVLPDAFIKRDGSVWAAYAPLPAGLTGRDCFRSAGDKRQAWQLTAGSARAIQIATSGEKILMLDADYKLWTTAGSWMITKLHNVLINLK